MMICDEVMAGWGRTGKMFAFENFGVKPDTVSFAKGVTCGYVQLGGVCVSKNIAAFFDDHLLSCGLTYSGHPLACAAGVACLNYYKNANILDNVNKSGKVLGECLEEIKKNHPCVGDVRYIGLFSAVELVKDKETREPLVPYGKDPDEKRIVMASHVDSVKNGGNYDGILGVMSAMEVLETVAANNIPHKHPLTAMIWTNEEGSLYPPAMMCSGIVCYDYLPEDIRRKFKYEDMLATKSIPDPTKTFGEALDSKSPSNTVKQVGKEDIISIYKSLFD